MSRLPRWITAAIALAGILIISGCKAMALMPQPQVPAQYVPAKKPLVVLVIEAPDPTGMSMEGETLAAHIESALRDGAVAPLVDSAEVASLRSRRSGAFSSMSTAQIDRAVGAQQVIRVELLRSSTSPGAGNDLLKGGIAATVSMIDVSSGTQLWPADGTAGATITYATPMVRAAGEVNASALQQNLHAGLADQIAKLFYAHEPS